MSWFALALVAMLCWSGSDLFSKMGSKPDDRLSHWKMVMAVGLVMGLHALYTVFAFFHTIPSLYLLYIFSWAITGTAEYLYFRASYRKHVLRTA